MKVALIVLLFAAPALAQSLFAALPGACGPANVSFNVKLDDTQHTPPLPEPRKAQAYFIQDKGVYPFGIGGTVESTIGIDGAWVGQNKNNSYFSAPVEPGEHHVCTSMHSHVGSPTELAHFTAEAGKAYYFRARVVPTPYGLYLFLSQVDSDEGKYLISIYPLSVSQPKK